MYIYISTFILYAINEQKTCVNTIRVTMHDTLHVVNFNIYYKVMINSFFFLKKKIINFEIRNNMLDTKFYSFYFGYISKPYFI